ncbi:WD repeat-containing protein 44 [Monascus purpureus]|uniref:WD repeat-containing protein 44 n=1 Tax=Monascus purpureus TaxID=5098 RepID=A0A507R6N9_MONPU|nr:WD repeat-containing protein 44 [Monascus purpureus]
MAEGSTGGTGGAIARSSTAPIITGNDNPSSDSAGRNSDSHGPATVQTASTSSKPGSLRTSQTFPLVSPSLPGHKSPSFQSSTPTALSFFEANADSSAIDPLSRHIIRRTNTEKSIPLRLLGKASYEAEARGTDDFSPTKLGSIRGDAASSQKSSKDKKKGGSFLSRIIPTRKRGHFSASDDDISEPDVNRMDTDSISQPIGFIPRFPRPPKYIKVRAHFKKEKTFNRVFVAQELDGADFPSSLPDNDGSTSTSTEIPGGHNAGRAIWALGFSKDGRYLAAAGQDKKVRVWAVISSPADRDAFEPEDYEGQDSRELPRFKAPVFASKPVQVYEGHTGCVLDLSWSKNNFLLSSSMDKTVRLWHVTRSECLCCFKHSDFVPSIQFHPRDDRFFLAGSLDTKLRLWSIPDKSVAFVATVPDMITSVAFTPDGRHSIAGCLNGLCNIYETDGLKLVGQLHIRSPRTRKAKGSKITGIDTITVPPNDPNGEIKVLITSNDSRVRLYNLRDRTLEAKFRGNENACSQIRASFSHSGKHVICGSEDRRAYIWPIDSFEKDTDKRAVEVLEAQSAMVTAAVMAPPSTKQILGFSEDPVYDICNPPPVTLVSNAHTGDQRNGESNALPDHAKLAQKSPSYLARSTHPGGDIIIIADYSGKIKVLRQDCAYHKRRFEALDTGSTISKRLLGRSNSARHSIASSNGKDSILKTPSERIISWRNSVARNERASMDSSRRGTRTRSPSPHMSRYSSPQRNSMGLPADYRSVFITSSPQSGRKSSMDSPRSSEEVSKPSSQPMVHRALQPPKEFASSANHDKDNPMWSPGDQSYLFWNKMAHDALVASSKKSPAFLSPNNGTVSAERTITASTLSSDYASSNGEADEGEVLTCNHCHDTNFRATKGRDGKQRLTCVNCRKATS